LLHKKRKHVKKEKRSYKKFLLEVPHGAKTEFAQGAKNSKEI
jgi:hypothetical protein